MPFTQVCESFRALFPEVALTQLQRPTTPPRMTCQSRSVSFKQKFNKKVGGTNLHAQDKIKPKVGGTNLLESLLRSN